MSKQGFNSIGWNAIKIKKVFDKFLKSIAIQKSFVNMPFRKILYNIVIIY